MIDNAPSHTALVTISSKIRRTSFRNHRIRLIWLRFDFESIDEIKPESKKALMAIPEKDYLVCFEDWKIRWYKSISSRGDKNDLQE